MDKNQFKSLILDPIIVNCTEENNKQINLLDALYTAFVYGMEHCEKIAYEEIPYAQYVTYADHYVAKKNIQAKIKNLSIFLKENKNIFEFSNNKITANVVVKKEILEIKK